MLYSAPLLGPWKRCHAAYTLTAFDGERGRAMEYLERARATLDLWSAWSAEELLKRAKLAARPVR